MRTFTLFLLFGGLSASAHAAEYLTTVTSEVYQTNGTQSEIARRGQSCIARNIHATDGQVILSSDRDAGVITAQNAFEYGSLPRWQLRSTLTFEAKDGRFRIVHTNIERFNDAALGGAGWYGVGKWWGSDWKRVQKELTDRATAVAQCVMAPEKKDDW
jgi:hypothetical protein